MKNSNEQCLKSVDKAELIGKDRFNETYARECNLSVNYGKQLLNIHLDKKVDILSKKLTAKPLTSEDVFDKLANDSIYSESLAEMIQKSKKILLILPDITRKSGAELLLDKLTQMFETANKEFSIIFATGTHRAMTDDEKKSILTPEIYNKYKDLILDHDAEDLESHTFFGKTRRNTPIFINKAYKAHDLIVTLAAVSYHYFAGFGGGRKMLIPGIAAKKTAIANHKLVLDSYNKRKDPAAVTGNLKANPVHDDIVEMIMIARAHCSYYAINTLLDDNGKIVDAIGGDLFMGHAKATERLKELTCITLNQKYDTVIVSCGGYPKDINMVQAQKSLDRATLAVKEGGKIIFIAENKDGYGNTHFKEFFDHPNSTEMFKSLLKDYQINRQTAYNLKNNLEKFEVYLYSEIEESDTKRMGFKQIKNVEEINSILADDDNTAFIPFAYNAFFEVS